MLTIICCVKQRLFVKRKKLRSTAIKQGSENGININFDAHDLLYLTFTINSTVEFAVSMWTHASTNLGVFCESFGFCNISVIYNFVHNLKKNLVRHQHKLYVS